MSSRAQEIWCLGDSFHDRDGCNRLPRRAREMLSTLTASTRWTWITGNQDPGFADHCGGAIVAEAAVAALILRHAADPAEPRPELSGPFHPKRRLTHSRPHVSRRSFFAAVRKLNLTTFGALTRSEE